MWEGWQPRRYFSFTNPIISQITSITYVTRAGDFPNTASPRDLSKYGCFSFFGNLQRRHFCTTVSIIPPIPNKNHHLHMQYNAPFPAGIHACVCGGVWIHELFAPVATPAGTQLSNHLKTLSIVNILDADLSSQLLALSNTPAPWNTIYSRCHSVSCFGGQLATDPLVI